MALKLNEAQMRQLLTSPQGPVWQELHRQGRAVQRTAQILVPTDQGQLKSSIVLEMDTQGGLPIARVGTNVKYAIWVHEGTGIYGPRKTPIRPRSARLLKWPIKNQSGKGARRYKGGKTANFAFAKQVKGMRPRPFLRVALERITGQS
jgi:phage gpG-like protein